MSKYDRICFNCKCTYGDHHINDFCPVVDSNGNPVDDKFTNSVFVEEGDITHINIKIKFLLTKASRELKN